MHDVYRRWTGDRDDYRTTLALVELQDSDEGERAPPALRPEVGRKIKTIE